MELIQNMINSNPFECINNLYNDTTESYVYDCSVSNNLIILLLAEMVINVQLSQLVNLKVAVVKIVLNVKLRMTNNEIARING